MCWTLFVLIGQNYQGSFGLFLQRKPAGDVCPWRSMTPSTWPSPGRLSRRVSEDVILWPLLNERFSPPPNFLHVPSKVLKSAIAQKSAMQFSRGRMLSVCVCVKQGCRIFLFDQKRNMRPLENCMADFCAMADLSTLLGTVQWPKTIHPSTTDE